MVFLESAPGIIERPKKRLCLDGRPTLLGRSVNDEALSGDAPIDFRDQPVGLRKMFALPVELSVPCFLGKHLVHEWEAPPVSETAHSRPTVARIMPRRKYGC
jgi:hypothetical protein